MILRKVFALSVALVLVVGFVGGQDSPKPEKRDPGNEKQRIVFERTPLKDALMELGKRSKVDVVFEKDIPAATLSVPITGAFLYATPIAAAATLADEQDLVVKVSDKTWTVAKAVPELSVVPEEKASGRYAVAISKTEVRAAIRGVATATQTEVKIIEAGNQDKAGAKAGYSDQVSRPFLRVRYATADYILREVGKQCGFNVEYIPSENRDRGRYEFKEK